MASQTPALQRVRVQGASLQELRGRLEYDRAMRGVGGHLDRGSKLQINGIMTKAEIVAVVDLDEDQTLVVYRYTDPRDRSPHCVGFFAAFLNDDNWFWLVEGLPPVVEGDFPGQTRRAVARLLLLLDESQQASIPGIWYDLVR